MTAVALSPQHGPTWSAADRAPLLRWLIFTGATVFAAVLLWRYGLIRLMIVSDRTYLSSVIALIYVARRCIVFGARSSSPARATLDGGARPASSVGG